ncbi:thiamine pyrophosphate-requiring protein [Cryobacterium sp. Sr8]|uniref:thiamine pyrophosphate-requiring protein n=1 Tax=Cryobacterium sp. Sr8 TaxID=1259203 RepID=UPI00106CAAB3|nr:thiamine pyrophosphate-requiring protein [Cryobacterium sp. Sr8]TFD78791.1 thiamine pyrophosphate-requiring protein [Cryobacterium sp. Sr8]
MTEKSEHQGLTVSDIIVRRLQDWGVARVYGYSGDGVNGLLDALRRANGTPTFIQARHEENAALMAVGEAKYGGTVGVIVSTQGPGAVHLLNGLYDAKLDGVPVVALVGQQHRSVLGSGYMQEVDIATLMADVAVYVAQVSSAEQIPMVIDRAFRKALSRRGPAVVILPHDVQSADAPEHPHEHGVVVTSATYSAPEVRSSSDQLRAAAELLSVGERPVMLVGRGAAEAKEAVIELAESLGAAIVTSLLGKPYVDESHPLVAGTMGHLGTTASAELLGECDGLLIVGSNDPWTEFYPAPGQARAVQIDIDPATIGNRYPVEVAITSDAEPALRSLLTLVRPRNRERWSSRVHDAVRRWHRIRVARAEVDADPLNPEAVVMALNVRLPGNAALALDVGSVVYWYARQLQLPPGVQAHVSSTLASMGCGLPYGIAAKLTDPARPVVVLAGDGGMQMTGIAELVTVASRWQDWPDPRFIVAVFDNGDLAEVSWEQREMEGSPRFPASQALPAFPYAEYARIIGLAGEAVRMRDDLGDAWDRAFASDRPYVLHFRTDPAVPLLPPLSTAGKKIDVMRAALEIERSEGGGMAARALHLLEEYVAIERDDSNGG